MWSLKLFRNQENKKFKLLALKFLKIYLFHLKVRMTEREETERELSSVGSLLKIATAAKVGPL